MNIYDSTISFEDRVDYLIGKLTLEQKISLIMNNSPKIDDPQIKAFNWWSEGNHGVGFNGRATIFPQSIGMGASFNKQLLEEVAKIIALEARAKFNETQKFDDNMTFKGLALFSPSINIIRDPRWGRNQESYCEDPHMMAEMAISFVKGLQENETKYFTTLATPKAFFAYSGPEKIRRQFTSTISNYDIYNTYTPAFRRVIKEANPQIIMTAYSGVNNELSTTSDRWNKKMLREQFGYKGMVVTDCGAIWDIFNSHKKATTHEDAASQAINGGIDLECGASFYFLIDCIKNGSVTEEILNSAFKRVMLGRFRLGLFDEEAMKHFEKYDYNFVGCDENLALARKMAAEGFVLLKNDAILPIKKDVKSIALIGPNITNFDVLLGNYSGKPRKYETIMDAFKNSEYTINYSEGCCITKHEMYSCGGNHDSFTDALISAELSDIVIMGVGLSPKLEGEDVDALNPESGGSDRISLELPSVQMDLIKEISKVNKNIILVNFSGSCIAFDNVIDDVKAILQVWYPGAEGGLVIRDVLEGKVKPTGRLPITFYKRTYNLPDVTNYNMEGRTYRYITEDPLFEFGYGLSYDEITFNNPKILGDNISLNVESNDKVIVQVYIKSDNAIYKKKLVYFDKLNPGSIDVSISIDKKWFLFYNEDGTKNYEEGDFTIIVTSRNIVGKSDYIEFNYSI